MTSNTLDLEKGCGIEVSDRRVSSSSGPHSQAQYRHSSSAPLKIFQTLIGITTNCQLGGSDQNARPRLIIRHIFFPPKSVGGRNIGLYQRSINEEWKNRIAYIAASYFLNCAYILQILLAATFTALSAYQDKNSITLTILGAVNTVLAGILAWVKGQGMPNRFRRARDQYSNIVKQIEVTERLFLEYDQLFANIADGEDKLDPKKEVEKLLRMFDTARQDQQNNYPDMYVSSQNTADSVARDEDLKDDVRKKTEEVKAEFVRREQDLLERLRVLEIALKVSHGNGESEGPKAIIAC